MLSVFKTLQVLGDRAMSHFSCRVGMVTWNTCRQQISCIHMFELACMLLICPKAPES